MATSSYLLTPPRSTDVLCLHRIGSAHHRCSRRRLFPAGMAVAHRDIWPDRGIPAWVSPVVGIALFEAWSGSGIPGVGVAPFVDSVDFGNGGFPVSCLPTAGSGWSTDLRASLLASHWHSLPLTELEFAADIRVGVARRAGGDRNERSK